MARNTAFSDEAKMRYLSLKGILGKNVAIFVCCAFCDLPYIQDMDVENWEDYVQTIGIAKHFSDGATDFRVAEESEKTKEQRWQETWGFGAESSKYTSNDYIRLDELFKSYSSRLVSAGGYDKFQEDTLRHCCRLALERDKCVSKGGKENVDMAAKLDKMIQDNLGSENLRKKDAKPVEEARLDNIVDAMQKKYGCGKDMTVEQCKEVIAKWMTSHRYPVTKDAAEHIIECIINSTRRNNDEPELTELPKSMRIPAKNDEFEAAPSKDEQEVYKYLGLERNS